jgi:hypothetical protein
MFSLIAADEYLMNTCTPISTELLNFNKADELFTAVVIGYHLIRVTKHFSNDSLLRNSLSWS